QGANGKQPVQVWMHGEFLVIGNRKMKGSFTTSGEDESIKMARSKGNVILVDNLKEWGGEPMAYRYLLMTAHYRSKLNFTVDSLTAAQNGLNNLREDLAALPRTEKPAAWSEEAEKTREAFQAAINDDLDLPTALSITREAAHSPRINPAERWHLVLDFDRVLGLQLDTVAPKTAREVSPEALALVQQRDAARASRDWKRSDELRSQLQSLGFEVRDTAKGTELA
ncbi:MAG TPA: hypothetical protein VFN23_07315, partial [Ktedonobacteraceae bacterium]|nr:hypothetical protein [Ktedonobacteraceae bacterium]